MRPSAPGVVLGAAGALVAGLVWWGTADVSDGDPDTAATALVPPDGYRTVGGSDGATEVTEHARLTGPEMVLTSPPLIGGAVATVLDGDPFDWRIWRSTTTSYDATADGSGEQVTTLRRLTDDGVEQVAAYGPFPVVFDPPLLEIPADVEDGSTWSGSGLAYPDGPIAYDADFSADDDGDGCLRITGNVEFTQDGESLLDSPTDERWCPGRGIVSDDEAVVPDLDLVTGPTTPSASGVEDWEAVQRSVQLANSVETAADTGGPAALALDLPPAVAAEGGLVVANSQGRDVFGLVRSGNDLVRQWVAHPGGSITSLASSGDVTVAGTSRREVVGYGPRGQWLWSHGLDDVPVAAPLAVDEDHLVVTSAAGEVETLDPRTGEVLWSASLSARIGLPPVSDGDVVVVADEAGSVAAYDVTSGAERWSTEVDDALALAVVDDRVVVRASAAAQAFDLDDGTRLWSTRLRTGVGSATVVDLGRTVALSTDQDTIALDASSGEEQWREEGAEVTAGLDGTLVQVTDHRLVIRDDDGELLGRWRLRGLRGTVDLLTIADSGLWVADSVGALVEVAP